jgi:hypothetical protein
MESVLIGLIVIGLAIMVGGLIYQQMQKKD